MARVCVIGAGPAGCVFAARMADYGHAVTLVERQSFPRSQLGESLTPGVPDLLSSIGAEDVVARCDRLPLTEVLLDWDQPAFVKSQSDAGFFSLNRGQFDAALRDHAARHGVTVRQPAKLRMARHDGIAWWLDLETGDKREEFSADFLAYATGRAGKSATRVYAPYRTMALYGYWQVKARMPLPHLSACADGWLWGVPLPAGLYNLMLFRDPATVKTRSGHALTERFLAMLGDHTTVNRGTLGTLAAPVRAVDATAFLDEAPISRRMVRLGDAAMALDPVSSSGVQKSIQSALAAAVSVNTLLDRPADGAAAMSFYGDSLRRTASRHDAWTAAHYARVVPRLGTSFWNNRAGQYAAPTVERPVERDHLATGTLRLCPQAQIVETPVAAAAHVITRPALTHPLLDGPVAYLSGVDVAPLLRRFPSHMTGLEIARCWVDLVPKQTAVSILAWLLNKGVVFHVED